MIQLLVFDTSMNQIGIVDDYEYLQWTRNWYTPDTWQFTINRYKQNASTILSGRSLDASDNWNFGGFIGINTGIGLKIGIIERIELPLDSRGKISETYTISGRGVESVLSTRIASYGWDAGDGYDSQNVEGETAMRHYVDVNCVTTDASRVITGLTLHADDHGKGSVVDYKARFQRIDEILEAICRETGLSYLLAWSGTGLNFEFQVVEGTDKSATVTLSTGFGNIEAFNFTNSILEKRNLLLMGGQDEAAIRITATVYDTTEPTGWTRREAFIDARDLLTVGQLAQRGAEQLTVLGESLSLEVQYIDGMFVLGTDFNLGDIVTVVYPDIVTAVARVITIIEDISPERGLKRTLIIGKEKTDMRSIVKGIKRQTAGEVLK